MYQASRNNNGHRRPVRLEREQEADVFTTILIAAGAVLVALIGSALVAPQGKR